MTIRTLRPIPELPAVMDVLLSQDQTVGGRR